MQCQPHFPTTISHTPTDKPFPEDCRCLTGPFWCCFQASEPPASDCHTLVPQRNSKVLKIPLSFLLYQIIFLGRALPKVALLSGKGDMMFIFPPWKPLPCLTWGWGSRDGRRKGKVSTFFFFFGFLNTVLYFNMLSGHYCISTFHGINSVFLVAKKIFHWVYHGYT